MLPIAHAHWLFGFQRFLRQRIKRFAACLKSGLVRPSISQALAFDASRQNFSAHQVIGAELGSVVIAEIEFCL
jgi:hypothetical protein